MQNSGSIV